MEEYFISCDAKNALFLFIIFVIYFEDKVVKCYLSMCKQRLNGTGYYGYKYLY